VINAKLSVRRLSIEYRFLTAFPGVHLDTLLEVYRYTCRSIVIVASYSSVLPFRAQLNTTKLRENVETGDLIFG
jgi:hypothetical protein